MPDLTFEGMRAAIHTMLLYPRNFKWSVQGFGMMRTYIGPPEDPKLWRLNVWDSELAVPDCSIIHDHPWRFKSWIINGEFLNRRLVEDFHNGVDYRFMVIKTGEGGGPDGPAGTIRLRCLDIEKYKTGGRYEQEPTEIHASGYMDGTVTLNYRERVGDGEHARVFWHPGDEWVDAKPRPADELEVAHTTGKALTLWGRN